MNAVTTLIAMIEAGGFPMGRAADAFGDKHGSTPIDVYWGTAYDAFLSDVSAAFSLLSVVLPEWDATVSAAGYAELQRPVGNSGWTDGPSATVDGNPARALLIAILKVFE